MPGRLAQVGGKYNVVGASFRLLEALENFGVGGGVEVVGGFCMAERLRDHFPPKAGRVHEVYGPGCYVFAAIACELMAGPAMWLSEASRPERLNPRGLLRYCDPDRLVLVNAPNHRDLLATTEEALRSNALTAVVCETSKALDLTAGRRLQLAAKRGGGLGLLLIPKGMGSAAAETRWHCHPQFAKDDSTQMRWTIEKNKAGILTHWTLRWNDQNHELVEILEVEEPS